jgi:hypothetical protein
MDWKVADHRAQAGLPVPALVMRLPYGKHVWRAQGVPDPAEISAAGGSANAQE